MNPGPLSSESVEGGLPHNTRLETVAASGGAAQPQSR
jgi:hypothetical protein